MRMFHYVHDVEMRLLRESNSNNNNATSSINAEVLLPPVAAQPPLPKTNLLATMTLNSDSCLLAYYYVLISCCNQSMGQSIAKAFTNDHMLVGGMTAGQLDLSSFIGTVIGCGAMSAGGAINACASRTENPVLRVAGMATADTCITAGEVIVFTPAATIVGAAALGLPLSTAALTTSSIAWLASLPPSVAGAACYHYLCCKPQPDEVRPAMTTRLAQYEAVSARMGEPSVPPPAYNSIAARHNGSN